MIKVTESLNHSQLQTDLRSQANYHAIQNILQNKSFTSANGSQSWKFSQAKQNFFVFNLYSECFYWVSDKWKGGLHQVAYSGRRVSLSLWTIWWKYSIPHCHWSQSQLSLKMGLNAILTVSCSIVFIHLFQEETFAHIEHFSIRL